MFNNEYEENDQLSFAKRQAMIDGWNEEYQSALIEIKERTAELRKAMKKMEDRAL